MAITYKRMKPKKKRLNARWMGRESDYSHVKLFCMKCEELTNHAIERHYVIQEKNDLVITTEYRAQQRNFARCLQCNETSLARGKLAYGKSGRNPS